ncbi:MAG TPA: bifunctional precorrin-2 dehydrogenase/sirohydrochlorin ferrochelatase [Caulobacteraceae bacterium]|jgi:precorrin-2 dehydrogenase/sirohydrochlorin ferrochelatase
MDSFPAFFPLKGRRVVIAGEGEPAEARARLLAGSPAEIVRIDSEAAFDPAAYEGAHLVFIASHDDDFARQAATAARAGRAPVNVFDRPAVSDFHTPAIVDRGAVVAAVGTTGSAPLMAQLLRAEVEARVPEGAGAIASLLGERRPALTQALPDLVQRRSFLRAVLAGPVARAAETGDMTAAVAALDGMIAAGWTSVGRAWLIVRPAADDLISLRAQRALNFADVIVAADEASQLIATHARRDAERCLLETTSAAEIADRVRSGQLVAVVDPTPELAAALAGADVVFETLSPAPPGP